MRRGMKLLYKPFGLIVSVLGGVLAGALFKRVWRAVADDREAPSAKDRDRTWREVTLRRSSRVLCSAESRRSSTALEQAASLGSRVSGPGRRRPSRRNRADARASRGSEGFALVSSCD
jgi:hypothetical protein